MRNSFSKGTLVAILLTIFSLHSCKKGGSDDSTQQTKATVPTLTTTDASAITHFSAQSGGTILTDGGASITARGICVSAAQNPTISSSHTIDGSGAGTFTSTVTGLTSATTTYYIRAYATNSAGTGYGNQITISTIIAPTVSIVLASAYSDSAVIDFKTTDGGGAIITATGVCYSTMQNPTIADTKTLDGSGVSEFITNLTGLSNNTTYYIRAYATNSVGTSYSAQISFTTTFRIGQNYGGGKIFFIDATNIHGFIVSTNDQSTGAQWDNTSGNYVSPGAFSTTDGFSNTAKIIQTLGTGNAASICQAYRGGGYNDWYLPSRAELMLMYANKNLVYPDNSVQGVFNATYYWSSTESTSYIAFATSIFFGNTDVINDNTDKTSYYSVRAIRTF